jgi:protein-S-isoprenylcysteine O-methyltransferase Ste14
MEREAQNELDDKANVIVFPPVLFLSAVAFGIALQIVWTIHLRAPLPARIIGALLIPVGIATVLGAKKAMQRAGTKVHPGEPTTAIVTDGPYRFTRNPIYLGATTAYLGLTLACNALWPVLTLMPFFWLLHWGVVQREERYLEQKFGQSYLNYKSRVRRWI